MVVNQVKNTCNSLSLYVFITNCKWSKPEINRQEKGPHSIGKKYFFFLYWFFYPDNQWANLIDFQSDSSPSGRKTYHGASVLVWHQSRRVLLLSFPNTRPQTVGHTYRWPHRQTHTHTDRNTHIFCQPLSPLWSYLDTPRTVNNSVTSAYSSATRTTQNKRSLPAAQLRHPTPPPALLHSASKAFEVKVIWR